MTERPSQPCAEHGCESSSRTLYDACGDRQGPTVVITVAIHGNERGSVVALQRLTSRMQRLEIRPRGRLVVLVGNLEGLRRGVRFVDHDLNRLWYEGAPHQRAGRPLVEHLEKQELEQRLNELIAEANGPLTLIDLHSFSGHGEPFLIAPDHGCPDELLGQMPFPVIHGLNRFVRGTMAGWMESRGQRTLILEGGRESDPEVPVTIEAFLWQALARLGLIDSGLVPKLSHRHWQALQPRVRQLPAALQTVYRQRIEVDEGFRMEPGFSTFDQVGEGALLARNRHGEIRAPFTGYLLMPLYQGQGEDGFFMAEREPERRSTA